MDIMKLPYSILSDILLKIRNLRSYIGIDDKLDTLIKSVFLDYEEVYDKVFPNWRNNYIGLIKKLLELKKYKSLDFFLDNYEYDIYLLLDAVIEYGNLQLMEDIISDYNIQLNLLKYQILALSAVKYGKLEILKFLAKNYKLDYYDLVHEAIKYDQLNILQFLLLRFNMNTGEIQNIAERFNSEKILKYLNR